MSSSCSKLKATRKLKAAVREAYQMEVDYADEQTLRLLKALDAQGFFGDAGARVHFGPWRGAVGTLGVEHAHAARCACWRSPSSHPGSRGARSTEGVAAGHHATLRAIAGLPNPGMGETRLDLRQSVPDDRVVKAAGNLYGNPQTSARNPVEKVIETRRKRGIYSAITEADPGEARTARPATPGSGPWRTGTERRPKAPGRRFKRQLCALGYMSGPECRQDSRNGPPGRSSPSDARPTPALSADSATLPPSWRSANEQDGPLGLCDDQPGRTR